MELLGRALVPGPNDIPLVSNALLTCACMPDISVSSGGRAPDSEAVGPSSYLTFAGRLIDVNRGAGGPSLGGSVMPVFTLAKGRAAEVLAFPSLCPSPVPPSALAEAFLLPLFRPLALGGCASARAFGLALAREAPFAAAPLSSVYSSPSDCSAEPLESEGDDREEHEGALSALRARGLVPLTERGAGVGAGACASCDFEVDGWLD